MSAPRRSSEGCGEWSASSPSGRRMPSRRRISVNASRPVASTAPSARTEASGSRSSTLRAAPACTTITETECATTSCSSRAIRTRSRATASRSRSVRSRSSCSVRALSSAVRCARPRPKRPSAQQPEKRTTGKTTSPIVWSGPSAVTTTTSAPTPTRPACARRRGRCAPIAKDRMATRIVVEARFSGGVSASASATATAPTAASTASGAVLRHAIAAVRTAPSSRAGTSGVSRTEVRMSSISMTTPSAAARARSVRRGRGNVTSRAPRWAGARAARSRAAGGGRRAARRRRARRARAG